MPELRRETDLMVQALCDCAQSLGQHARNCTGRRALRALPTALLAHDRRLLAAVCSSCSQPVDPDNLCRVNGITYHLGNCPQPHGTPPPPNVWDQALALPCPHCHAQPGDLCTGVPEGSEPQIHLRRIESLP